MNKQDVIDFFDKCAPEWDAGMIRNEQVIDRIMENAGIREGVSVLDVACGTGVLFPDYLARNVECVVGVDISPAMAEIAKEKAMDQRIRVVCGDIEEIRLGKKFDCCMVYNAFPHFPNPEKLIRALSEKICRGGRLSIAHGMSRARINRCHEGAAGKVSLGLLGEAELAEIMKPYFRVDCMISNENMYQVSGVKW